MYKKNQGIETNFKKEGFINKKVQEKKQTNVQYKK